MKNQKTKNPKTQTPKHLNTPSFQNSKAQNPDTKISKDQNIQKNKKLEIPKNQ